MNARRLAPPFWLVLDSENSLYHCREGRRVSPRLIAVLFVVAAVFLAAVAAPVVDASPPANAARPVAAAFPPRLARPTKWGMGVYAGGGDVLGALKATRPGVILLVDPDIEWARSVRQTFPEAFIVGRLYLRETEQPLDNPEARGAAFADRVAQVGVPLKGVVDAWMSYNEVVGTNHYDEYRAYNTFQVAFARRLQGTHGIAAVAANDGSGAVAPEDYPKYFAEAIRESAYFGVHAYSPPRTRSLKVEPDWNILRYRKIHEALQLAGIVDVPMVITESGLGDGWKGYSDFENLAREFAWFTDELHRDDYMIGHAAFGLFTGDQWANFNLKDSIVLQRMGGYTPALLPPLPRIVPPTPTPAPTVAPPLEPTATPVPQSAIERIARAIVPETFLPGPAVPQPTPLPPAIIAPPVVPTPATGYPSRIQPGPGQSNALPVDPVTGRRIVATPPASRQPADAAPAMRPISTPAPAGLPPPIGVQAPVAAPPVWPQDSSGAATGAAAPPPGQGVPPLIGPMPVPTPAGFDWWRLAIRLGILGGAAGAIFVMLRGRR